MNQCVAWLICFRFPRLPCVCYHRHDAHWSNCCGKALPNCNVPYGSVSCCCGIFVIELVILYFYYLNICNFQIYCSEETHLTIHVVRWKLSGFFWFPVCLWEVPEFSGRCLGCGREDKIYLSCILLLIYTWIPLSKYNSSAGFCFQFPAESGTWLLLPNGFIKGSLMLSYLAFHFFETLYSSFQHICNGKLHSYKILFSCYNT